MVVIPPVTPTPPPVATPPPSPVSETILDFDRDRSFTDIGVRLETLTTGGQTTTTSSELQTSLGSVGFNFFANPRRYSLFYERETESFSTLTSVNGIFSGEVFDGFTTPSSTDFISRFSRSNRTGEQFVGHVQWQNNIATFTTGNQRTDRKIIRLFNFGIPTISSDLPTSGFDIYRFTFFVFNERQNLQTGANQSLQAAMDLRMNWQTGEMTGIGRVPCLVGQVCPIPETGDVTITARFDGSGRFQGNIGGPAGFRGEIVGRFYGPRAIEIGGVMKGVGGGVDDAIGSFTARSSVR